MDTLTSYSTIVMKILGDFAALVQRTSQSKEIDTVCLFDEKNDNYMVYRVGWEKSKRIRIATMFVRIVAGKVWIEENWTEMDLAQELVDAGIPSEDVRLGILHPSLREPTCAVA